MFRNKTRRERVHKWLERRVRIFDRRSRLEKLVDALTIRR